MNLFNNISHTYFKALQCIEENRIPPLRKLPQKLAHYIIPSVPDVAHYLILSKNPIIILAYSSPADFLMMQMLRGYKAYFLFVLPASYENWVDIRRLKKIVTKNQKLSPQHKITYLCNTWSEYEQFGKENLNRIFCSHNCFADEKIFTINPDTKKIYNAIYNATVNRCKRHYLASDIERLALITLSREDEYVNKVKKSLENATWLNGPFSVQHRLFTKEEVCTFLNQAKVGLCLSAVEGAMYASIEYLLCGLPIVSTRSKGGRDVFYGSDYVEIVDDSPHAVAQGVKDIIARNISPYFVREKVLHKIKQHRDTFISYVQNIYDRENQHRDFRTEWDLVFFHSMMGYGKIQDLKKMRLGYPQTQKEE